MSLKNYIVLLFIMLLGTSIFANANEKYSVTSIANAMLKETPLPKNKDFGTFIKGTQANDDAINEQFNSLSVDEKYEVLEIVRNANLKKSVSIQTKDDFLLNHAVEEISNDLKIKGIFVNDISDEELKYLIIEKIKSYEIIDSKESTPTASATIISCPYEYFPLSISYAQTPSIFSSAYYYSSVTNSSSGEFPCDVQLWYNNTNTA